MRKRRYTKVQLLHARHIIKGFVRQFVATIGWNQAAYLSSPPSEFQLLPERRACVKKE